MNIYAQNDCLVEVTITTNIDSSYISIDEEEFHDSKVIVKLPIGDYRITLMSSEGKWGSDVIEDIVKITECSNPIYLHYNFKTTTVINSSPDATVYSGDSLIGYTPFMLHEKYTSLTLRKNGYADESLLIGDKKVQPKVNLNFLGDLKEEPFIHSTLFKLLVGSAIVLGGTAAYLKIEADKNFDRYLDTRQQNYLDNTDQFDLYSGLAFGALQINFGVLLYYFLTE